MRGRLVCGRGQGREKKKMYVSGKSLIISNYNVPLKSGRVEAGSNTEEL